MAVGAHPEPESLPVLALASSRYINRELSRLDFDERVLAMAEDVRLPLLERVRFLAIFSQNLDDFFQVRVAGLKEQVLAAVAVASPDGMSPLEQLKAIRTRVEGLVDRQVSIYNRGIVPALADAGISVVRAEEMSKKELSSLHTVFREQIFPVLTPLAVDPGHPFPYISHLSLNLAVRVRDPLHRQPRFARVKVPPVLPRFIPLDTSTEGGERYMPLEDVIALHLPALFPGMEIIAHYPFRVTRDGDLDDVDSDAEDLLAAIQTELRRRRRHARVVRLEVDPRMSSEVLELLMRELELQPADVYQIDGLLDMGSLSLLTHLDRPDLKEESWTPTTQPRLRGIAAEVPDLFAVLRAGDVLAHHPYDSFATSVEAFIDHAASDPEVLAIKQTLYRTSGPASPIVRALIRAAERGKQVVALVEIKARGDEQANIGWARALEEANVHVVYGLLGLKTHAKVTLVVRREGGHIQHYLHVSTGNYNPNTARIYEDVSILSADSDLGADVTELFNLLTGYSRQSRYRKLLVAPTNLRTGITQLIEREGVVGGRIIIKVNNLIDSEIIDALYAASQGGAQVDLLIRSMCSLRPGVPGLSERIRVRSIVGQFLEHSRIFSFGNGGRPEYYLGSSDLMPRNLDRRVEAVVPVTDPRLRHRLQQILDVSLADDVLAWELGPDGGWHKVPTVRGLNSHNRFKDLALESAHGNGLNGVPHV
ncbi:MAG: polyphosphate kinase 1 [Chloroflexi bacterium]|nr:MAG: polyphosphate kinase 1 [Chloroflexota bacterium]TME40994.1 MAG: polyphosphate kinase 1 [Chloroflexota bacterium]TME52655.1 MAG: polyphosphate kinase 1 [Chloroflexota bacterium]